MKRVISCLLLFIFIFCFGLQVYANHEIKTAAENAQSTSADFDVNAKSAILMEASTGKILYSKAENEKYSPASVTKIMTLLLVMEALSEERIRLGDMVSVSDYAASMGGSQVYLKEGEKMSVEELLKCTVIASANDAAVALAELVYGSESNFVHMMNKRASELGMENTNFENVTGLDDTAENHVSSAEDIAIMSRELIKHSLITKYSSLWQDTIRNGEFRLTNTNRLVRFYDGCNGLKTGSTDKAGFCISATAKRDGMQLIAVVMGSPTRDERNLVARNLLDYGFSNYALFSKEEREIGNISVRGGESDEAVCIAQPFSCVISKRDVKSVEEVYQLPEYVKAPVANGYKVGKITYKIGDTVIGESEIVCSQDIEKISLFGIISRILMEIFAN